MTPPRCPDCKKEMTLVGRATRSGRDGRESTFTYRCRPCWKHETVTKKREPLDFQGTVNL